MKQYGQDLLRTYNRLKQTEQSLTAQVKKRNQYLITNAGDEVLERTHLNLQFDSNDTQLLINQIIAIEKAYAEQAKQLNMFDGEQ